MKLATIENGTADGRLAVVSHDLSRMIAAPPGLATLQAALEGWDQAEPALRLLAAELEDGRGADIVPFAENRAMAPLPRSWQWLDGSAFPSHGALMQKVFGMDPVPKDRPLMYQGLSHRFLSGSEPVAFAHEADGIDFEGEFGVITDFVPAGVTAAQAGGHIKLLVQINDWSLRVLAPGEMKTGFGWIQAKPACSMAPLAVTPDELGDAWANARVARPLHVAWNGVAFGHANGDAMAFGFDELIAHAAATRSLCAGTIVGSGTVSNENFHESGSSCIAERRAIEMLDEGAPRTGYMRFGDRVRMETFDHAGRSVFGRIDQEVRRATSPASP